MDVIITVIVEFSVVTEVDTVKVADDLIRKRLREKVYASILI